MKTNFQQISIREFKAKCFYLIEEINKKHKVFTITKHGVPIAKLVPVGNNEPKLFGCMEGSVTIIGDIISPLDTK